MCNKNNSVLKFFSYFQPQFYSCLWILEDRFDRFNLFKNRDPFFFALCISNTEISQTEILILMKLRTYVGGRGGLINEFRNF